jgi:hypothetical protein
MRMNDQEPSVDQLRMLQSTMTTDTTQVSKREIAIECQGPQDYKQKAQ